MRVKNFVLATAFSLFLSATLNAQDLPVVVQAELGIPGNDFRTVDTLGANAVIVKSDVVSSFYPGNANRVITYEVTFPDTGTYDLYARVLVGSGTYDDDSYFYANGFGEKTATLDADWIRANGLAAKGYTGISSVVDGNGASGSGVWKWINMSEYTGDENPITFHVESGALSQTFQVGAREDGLYFDKFVFGKSHLYFTVSNLNRGEAGTLLPPDEMPPGTPIAAGQPKFLGSEWDYNQAPNFASYWNQSTPGNAGKWGSVEYTRDIMDWTVLDSTYNVARRYKMPFKEHTLIWGAQQPSWIGALDSAQQRQEIEEWYAALAERYDTIEYIDVVNEPIHNAPNGMVPWGTTTPNVNYAGALGGAGVTGWDWIITAFRLARQYFPDSKLILNEYSVINSLSTTQQYIEIINLLKAENLIDGIGEQGHAFTTYGISSATLKSNLDLLAATGIPIYITELDIDGLTDLTQLKEYQRVFPIFWEHPAVEGITLWGYRYGVWRQEQGAYLITDEDIERPALTWLKAYVNDTLTLTTQIELVPSGGIDTIYTGDKLKINAVVSPVNTTIPNVTWSVSPVNRASINSAGTLTAIESGTITVTATAWDGSGVSGSKTMFIANRLVDSLDLYTIADQDSVFVNDTLRIKVQVYPEQAVNKNVTWAVSPSSLAQINTNGLLTAKGQGMVTVKATAKDGSGVYDTLCLKLMNRMVESIVITAEGNQQSVIIGGTISLHVDIIPGNATDTTFTWSVTPVDAATIDPDGILTALNSGEVTITATANDESGVSGSLEITIADPVNLSDNDFDTGIRVFPNPVVNGTLTIEGLTEGSRVELFDMAGSKVAEYRVTDQDVLPIQVRAGQYMLIIHSNNQLHQQKILVH